MRVTKAVEHCLGKLIRDCGLDDALVESKAFGPKIIDSVLNGSHYDRSLRGFLLIEDTIETLKWEAFWKEPGDMAHEIREQLNLLSNAFAAKKSETSVELFNKYKNTLNSLKTEYDKVTVKCSENSEICRFFEVVAKGIRILKELIAADRNGDWLAHVQAVQDAMPLFQECDSVHYLRYGSFYLEQIRKLPNDYPDIYENFLKGHFAVKTNPGVFNAGSPDMKLEQTIQRSQKSSHGVISETRKVCYRMGSDIP